MGGNLAKAPLLAVLFAALLVFAGVFVPLSEGYAQALDGVAVLPLGYVLMIAYGLLAAVVLALVFGGSRWTGARLAAACFAAMLGCMWLSPFLEPVLFGEATGTMTRADCLFRLAQGAAATAVMALLALLLYKTPAKEPPKPGPQPPQPKVKIKAASLAISLLVLPVVYFIAAFCSRYFLLLRNQAALEFHTGETTMRTFLGEVVNTMLNNARSIPLSLGRGLLLAAFLLPLLLPLADKRGLFIAAGVMLMESAALLYLLPNPLMPDAVRMAHLIEAAALNALYGPLAAFLLHRCVVIEAPPLPAAKPAAAGAPAAKPAAPVKAPAPARPK